MAEEATTATVVVAVGCGVTRISATIRCTVTIYALIAIVAVAVILTAAVRAAVRVVHAAVMKVEEKERRKDKRFVVTSEINLTQRLIMLTSLRLNHCCCTQRFP